MLTLNFTSPHSYHIFEFLNMNDKLIWENFSLEKCVIISNGFIGSYAEGRGCQCEVHDAEGILIVSKYFIQGFLGFLVIRNFKNINTYNMPLNAHIASLPINSHLPFKL